MNFQIVGLSQAFAVVVNSFPPTATEKAFKLALKYASRQRLGKLADTDLLRLVAKATSDDSSTAQAFSSLTRMELQQATFAFQLLASDAVAMGVVGDSFGKRLLKAAEKANPPVSSLIGRKEALSETVAAMSSAVSEDAITLGDQQQQLRILDTPVIQKLTALGGSSSNTSKSRKKGGTGASPVVEYICSSTRNDSSTARAHAARRSTNVSVVESQALVILSAAAAATS